mmetsp:Transcript_5201/g.15812  ORF Transcript_5201/g.15812 Transcript_5201/m.15812 type:complete len:251 (-) Transcript_5201:71-823(-)
MPNGIQVKNIGNTLEILMTWFRPSAWSNLVFTLIWNVLMVIICAAAIGTKSFILTVGFIFLFAAGVNMTYLTAALFLNTTHIVVESSGALSAYCEPLPWGGYPAPIPVSTIDQLYCEKNARHGKHGKEHIYYRVKVVINQGDRQRQETLVKGLDELQRALFIEQQIEHFLGIPDRPVPGEIERDAVIFYGAPPASPPGFITGASLQSPVHASVPPAMPVGIVTNVQSAAVFAPGQPASGMDPKPTAAVFG